MHIRDVNKGQNTMTKLQIHHHLYFLKPFFDKAKEDEPIAKKQNKTKMSSSFIILPRAEKFPLTDLARFTYFGPCSMTKEYWIRSYFLLSDRDSKVLLNNG